MAYRQLPDPELLRKLVTYEPETGRLTWCARPVEMFKNNGVQADMRCKIWNSKNAGNEAFKTTFGNHLSGSIFGEVHLAHRVAWAIHYGVTDFDMLDHINGNGRDNRIANLRLASRAINSQNAQMRHDCTSGVTGVHLHTSKRWGRPRWVARIQCGKRRLFLGSFDTFEEAAAARRNAERKLAFGPAHGKRRNG